MKQIFSLLTVCLLCSLLAPCALAAESHVALTYDLTADGENFVTVRSGDIVTVTFTIRRTDSEENYSLNVLQNEIMYDRDFFEFVENSIVIGRAQYAQFDTRVGGEHIVKVSNMLVTCGAEEVFCTFQLKVIASSGSGRVYCDQAKAFDSNSDTVAITEQNLTVSVAGGSGNGGGVSDTKTDEANEGSPGERFTDVPASAWYYEAVDYVVQNGYFIGTTDVTFEPETTMTRAMFATVIARMAGADLSGYTRADFDDVAQGTWYTASVAWASENSIVLGYGDGNFGPADSLTREQMVVMMKRCAEYLGGEVSNTDTSLMNTFADSDTVSYWAVDAVAWAVNNGIINGTDTGLEPLRMTTRAEVVQILMNFNLTQ